MIMAVEWSSCLIDVTRLSLTELLLLDPTEDDALTNSLRRITKFPDEVQVPGEPGRSPSETSAFQSAMGVSAFNSAM